MQLTVTIDLVNGIKAVLRRCARIGRKGRGYAVDGHGFKAVGQLVAVVGVSGHNFAVGGQLMLALTRAARPGGVVFIGVQLVRAVARGIHAPVFQGEVVHARDVRRVVAAVNDDVDGLGDRVAPAVVDGDDNAVSAGLSFGHPVGGAVGVFLEGVFNVKDNVGTAASGRDDQGAVFALNGGGTGEADSEDFAANGHAGGHAVAVGVTHTEAAGHPAGGSRVAYVSRAAVPAAFFQGGAQARAKHDGRAARAQKRGLVHIGRAQSPLVCGSLTAEVHVPVKLVKVPRAFGQIHAGVFIVPVAALGRGSRPGGRRKVRPEGLKKVRTGDQLPVNLELRHFFFVVCRVEVLQFD